MAETSTLVGLQSQTPDIMGKLSQLLTISGQRAQVQQEQQTASQRANLAKYDWNKHVGADGTIDIDSLNDPELMHAAGDQYQNVLANAIATKQNQLSAQKTLLSLRGDQRKAFGEIMNGLRSDADVAEDNERGRQKVNEAMIQYGQQYGEQVLPVLDAYVKPLQKAPKGRLGDALKIIGLQTESVDTQLAQQAPQYTNTGGDLVPTSIQTPRLALRRNLSSLVWVRACRSSPTQRAQHSHSIRKPTPSRRSATGEVERLQLAVPRQMLRPVFVHAASVSGPRERHRAQPG
jgi:hypothetical protein